MDDLKKGYRETKDAVKQTLRDADGGEDLGDKVGNLGDDMRRKAGNAGDAVRRGVSDAGDAIDNETDKDRPNQP